MARTIVRQTPTSPQIIGSKILRQKLPISKILKQQNLILDSQRHGDVHAQDIFTGVIDDGQISPLGELTAEPGGLTISGGPINLQDSTIWRLTTGGIRTMPSQPEFRAKLETSVTNVTGDGTLYPVVFENERFDNGIYNPSTGLMTAPVNGIYLLQAGLRVSGFGAAHTDWEIHIVTDLDDSLGKWDNPGAVIFDNASLSTSILVQLNEADTAQVFLRVSGGTKVIDIIGGASTSSASYFYGWLVG